MNLILFKSNELLLLSEEEKEKVVIDGVDHEGEGETVQRDNNNNNDDEQQDHQDDESQQQQQSKRTKIIDHHHDQLVHPQQNNNNNYDQKYYKLLLSPNDKRTKHILFHLKKQSGDKVYVGCINGNKGMAIVNIILSEDDDDDHSKKSHIISDNYAFDEKLPQQQQQQRQQEVKRKNKIAGKLNCSKKQRKDSMKKDRRKVQLFLKFLPTAINPSVSISTTTTTTTTATIQQQRLPSQIPPTTNLTPACGATPPMYNITLVIAVPFPKVMKSLFSSVSSMGISRIIIIRSQLSNIEYCKSSCLSSVDEYEPLVVEGMSQGCHTSFPQIDINVNSIITKSLLNQLLLSPKESERDGGGEGEGVVGSNNDENTIKLFLDCGNEEYDPPPMLNVLLDKLQKNNNNNDDDINMKRRIQRNPHVVIAVGPERGWTDDEMATFENVGFISSMIGKSILKVETAVIASLGVVCSVLDTYR